MKAGIFLFVLLVVIIMNISSASAQKAEADDVYLRHQIGFNAAETIRLLNKESDNAFKINYRYKINSVTAIRSGISYSLNTSDSGRLRLDVKAGIDKEFKQSGKWRFYTGGDMTGGTEKISSGGRRNYQFGFIPFLGMLFYVNEHLSLSTEPGLLFQLRHYKNNNSFNPDNSETWVEMNIVNVGQFMISFHF